MTHPTTSPAEGSIVADKYRLTTLIGRGGWGDVFKAEHEKLGKVVAVKLLHAHLAGSPERLERFRREAQSASLLNHPNICHVFDHGVTDDGQPFYIMEFIDGITLADVLEQKKRLPASEAIALVEKLCDALQVAHDAGIVHRDLKPTNIIIRSDGEPVLVDFGLAKLTNELNADRLKLTNTGMTIGTPAFMSPEQALAQPLDMRSDIYSLGCILYCLLAGEPPFRGSTDMELMRQHAREEAPPLSADVEMPEHAKRALFRALAKDPAQRPQSAGEFKHELLTPDRVAEPKKRPWTSIAQNQRPIAVVALASLIGLATGVFGYQYSLNLNRAAQSNKPISKEAQARLLAKKYEDTATSLMSQAFQAQSTGRTARAASLARRAMETVQRFPDMDRSSAARIYDHAASVLANAGELDDAERASGKAVALLSSISKPSSSQLIVAKVRLGQILSKISSVEPLTNAVDFEISPSLWRAEKLLADARKDLQGVSGVSDLNAMLAAREAAILHDEGRWKEMVQLRHEYLPQMETNGTDPNLLLEPYINDAIAQAVCGNTAVAESDLDKASRLLKTHTGESNEYQAAIYCQAVQTFIAVNDAERAGKYFEKAKACFSKLPLDNPHYPEFQGIAMKYELWAGKAEPSTLEFMRRIMKDTVLNNRSLAYCSRLPEEISADNNRASNEDAWHVSPSVNLDEVRKSERLRTCKYLYLDGTDANDKTLAGFGKLPQLRLLNLQGTPISDQLSAILHNFPALSVLDVQMTAAADRTVAAAAALPLDTLKLSATLVSDQSGAVLGRQRTIKRLAVQDCQLTDAFLRGLGGSKSLESLSIRGTRMTDKGLQDLAPARNLRRLQLGTCVIKGTGLSALPGLTELLVIGPLVSEFDTSALSKMKGMKTLIVQSVPIGASKLTFLSNMKSLKDLVLASTDFDDSMTGLLEGLTALRSINLNHTRLTDAGLSRLVQMVPDLEALHISQNSIHDISPVVQLKRLGVLTMNGLDVGPEIIPVIKVMTSLKVVDVSNTKLSAADVVALARQHPNLQQLRAFGIKFAVQDVVDILGAHTGTLYFDAKLLSPKEQAELRARLKSVRYLTQP